MVRESPFWFFDIETGAGFPWLRSFLDRHGVTVVSLVGIRQETQRWVVPGQTRAEIAAKYKGIPLEGGDIALLHQLQLIDERPMPSGYYDAILIGGANPDGVRIRLAGLVRLMETEPRFAFGRLLFPAAKRQLDEGNRRKLGRHDDPILPFRDGWQESETLPHREDEAILHILGQHALPDALRVSGRCMVVGADSGTDGANPSREDTVRKLVESHHQFLGPRILYIGSLPFTSELFAVIRGLQASGVEGVEVDAWFVKGRASYGLPSYLDEVAKSINLQVKLLLPHLASLTNEWK